MARTFIAGVQAVLAGGQCYWLVIIRPNATDTWDPIAFGTLTATSLAGYTVQTGRLLNVGDIDNAIDFYKSPLALSPDVEVIIQNIAFDLVPTAYIGRKIEIRFGHGTTMSIATSDILFTGKIRKYALPALGQIKYTVRGLSESADKPVGEKLPDDVDDKYKGGIYPMAWGDWTDEEAYAPTVLNRDRLKVPDMIFDTESWKSFLDLRVYDEKAKTSYRAKISTDGVIPASNNKYSGVYDSGTTLSANMATGDISFSVGDYTLIAAAYGLDPTSEACILKIDDEYMLVINKPNTYRTVIDVERGYMGSAVADHAAGTVIHIVNEDLSNAKINVKNVFKPKQISGIGVTEWTNRSNPTAVGLPARNGTRFENIIDDNTDTSLDLEERWGWRLVASEGINFNINLIFPAIGITGATITQYLLIKGYARSRAGGFLLGEPAYLATGIRLVKDSNYISPVYITATSVFPDRENAYDNLSVGHADPETGFQLTVANGMICSTIEGLSSAGYSLNFKGIGEKIMTKESWWKIYGVGMLMEFAVSPFDFEFYARGEGRVNPGGYMNGGAGDLMENPSSVIEDFCKTADDGAAIVALDETSFDAAYTDRAAWKLAHSIYSSGNDNPKFKKSLEKILECSGLVCFERFDGSLALQTLDDPGGVTRTITDAEIKVDGNKMFEVETSSLDTEKIITSIEVKYRPVLPEDGKYAATVFCRRSGAAGEQHNFTGGGNEYTGYLQLAYETLGTERPLVIEADAIRDAATAEALAKLIIKLRYKPLEQLIIKCRYSPMDIEITDKIGLNSTILTASGLNDKTYMVTGSRIKPNIKGDKPDVRIVLTELSTATITEPTIWQDSLSAPTNVKTDVASGGRVIVEV